MLKLIHETLHHLAYFSNGTTAHLVVELAVDWCPITIDQLEGVRAIAIHVPKTIWDATVTEQEGHLVGGLWAETEEVPEHVWILYRVGGIFPNQNP